MNTKIFPQDQLSTRLRNSYGNWAVITGASSGIGLALAKQTASAGLNVVLVARSEDKLNLLATELQEAHGIESRVVPADLGTVEGITAVQQQTNDLDIGLFIASAGFGTSGEFLDGNIEEELAMLNVNCRALMMLTWHFGRQFAEKGRGGIVLLSSIVGFQGMPNAAHYAATKAYVQTLSEALTVELKSKGVDVLAAAPGPTNSGFASRADMQMGAALNPEDLARPILNALGKRTTTLPGFLSKFLVYVMAPLPRALRIRIMGSVMGGMTQHQTESQPIPKQA
ncbi:MAG: SDR family oxidoreductase [Chloroflexota bacterium]